MVAVLLNQDSSIEVTTSYMEDFTDKLVDDILNYMSNNCTVAQINDLYQLETTGDFNKVL